MRPVILFIAASLDGFIAREDGSVDWLFSDGDYGYKDFLASIDTVIMGRKTWEQAKTFEADPFAGKRRIVFSRRPSAQEAGVEVVADPVTVTRRLKEESGAGIWLVGGSDIISVLMNAGLVDDIVLSIHPILLGEGIPLFRGIDQEITLELEGTEQFKTGLLQARYRVLGRKR